MLNVPKFQKLVNVAFERPQMRRYSKIVIGHLSELCQLINQWCCRKPFFWLHNSFLPILDFYAKFELNCKKSKSLKSLFIVIVKNVMCYIRKKEFQIMQLRKAQIFFPENLFLTYFWDFSGSTYLYVGNWYSNPLINSVWIWILDKIIAVIWCFTLR